MPTATAITTANGYAKAKPIPRGKLPPEVDLVRLSAAIEGSRRALQKYREERVKAVKELAGFHYSDGGTDLLVPVNLISLYVSVMSAALISKNPRVMLSTFDKEAKAAVSACEAWANAEAARCDIAGTLQRVVIDALFSVGVCKVALCDPGQAASSGWAEAAGQPFAGRVDLDDFVFDVYARDFKEVSFIGHRYRVPLEVAKKLYRRGASEAWVGDERPDYNEQGDERIGMIGRGPQAADEFEEHCTFWEVYLPRHRLVLTLADDPGTGEGDEGKGLVRVQKWVGPPAGPYHVLGFQWVPGAPMPKGPVLDLIDLHRAVNRSYRKLIEDTDRWKSVLPVRGGATDDAGRLIQARNGEAFQCDNADSLKEVTYGGPGNGVMIAAGHFKDLFGWLAGNLDIMAGLSPQSKTASQDKMLNENSSRAVGDKQGTTVAFTARVFEALTWYWWNHPTKVMEADYQVPGAPDAALRRQVYPRGAADGYGRPMSLRREGPEPKVDVDPYSLSQTSPQQRLGFLNGFVQQMTPLLGLLAQQGVVFDAGKFVELVARYGDEPGLLDIFTVTDPVQRQGGDGGDGAGGMPASTSREYVRRSLGQDSQQAQDAGLEAAAERGGINGQLGG